MIALLAVEEKAGEPTYDATSAMGVTILTCRPVNRAGGPPSTLPHPLAAFTFALPACSFAGFRGGTLEIIGSILLSDPTDRRGRDPRDAGRWELHQHDLDRLRGGSDADVRAGELSGIAGSLRHVSIVTLSTLGRNLRAHEIVSR
jgi:hypothetical protein